MKQSVAGMLPMSLHLETIQHRHLAERVYEEVRARILRRELRTAEQIPVEQIALQLGVSRTPVLDAVKRLASEGLVEIFARRGSFVKGLTTTDIREVFQIREALETFGVRTAIRDGQNVALADELTAWVESMARSVLGTTYSDYLAFSDADRAFHQAIVMQCRNARMTEIYAALSVHVHIMRVHLLKEIEGPQKIQAEHVSLVEAVRAGDSDAAQTAVVAHLSAVRDRMMDHVAAQGGVL